MLNKSVISSLKAPVAISNSEWMGGGRFTINIYIYIYIYGCRFRNSFDSTMAIPSQSLLGSGNDLGEFDTCPRLFLTKMCLCVLLYLGKEKCFPSGKLCSLYGLFILFVKHKFS